MVFVETHLMLETGGKLFCIFINILSIGKKKRMIKP